MHDWDLSRFEKISEESGVCRPRVFHANENGKGGLRECCSIRSISRTTIVLENMDNVIPGETIDICLMDDIVHRAAVIWSADSLIIGEFQSPLPESIFAVLPKDVKSGGKSLTNNNVDVPDEETFGMRLRRLRTERAISQSHLARQLGVSKVTVWNWEKDTSTPRSQSLELLAEIFRCTVRELLFGSDGERYLDDGEQGSLRETLEIYKARIAQIAGVSSEDVAITISFGS